MRHRHHLREIDQCVFAPLVNEDIKLVEVAMNKSIGGQTDNDVH